MTCTSRCKGAKPKSKCKCICGGRYHAEYNKDKTTDGTRTVNAQMGGELGETIESLQGKSFMCLGTCGKSKVIASLLAYPHDGGLEDKDGEKWWLYYECPTCGYQSSWWKILNQLER